MRFKKISCSLLLSVFLVSNFFYESLKAGWKITNDTTSTILLVEEQGVAITIPAGQTKTFELKPYIPFHKYCVKKQIIIYQEGSTPGELHKKYALKEKSCSNDITENSFTMQEIAQKSPSALERFTIQVFDN